MSGGSGGNSWQPPAVPEGRPLVRICYGPNCSRNFAVDLLLEAEALARREPEMRVIQCGCLSHCEWGPNVMIGGRVHTDDNPAKRTRTLNTTTTSS